MTGQNRNHNAALACPRWEEFSLAPEPAPRAASFHASLRECAAEHVERAEPKPQKPASTQLLKGEPQQSPSVPRGRSWPWTRTEQNLPSNAQLQGTQLQVVQPAAAERSVVSLAHPGQPKRTGSRVLAHIRTWLQAKYSLSSTKRLRVMEMVPLGEKRFLAVVSVEGREFLIGGGASGVSVVTQLEGALGAASAPCTEFALQGKSA
jgi:hypothetical protein